MKFKNCLFLLLIVGIFLFIPNNVKANDPIKLYFFHGDGCPHCEDASKYLDSIKDKYPTLEIIDYEVWYNEENAKLMKSVQEKLGLTTSTGVPFIVIGSRATTGFSSSVELILEKNIVYGRDNKVRDVIGEVNGTSEYFEENIKDDEVVKTSLPLIGEVDAKKVSLPLAAVVIGLVDGFNPCAMWILLFLISTLIGMKDRKRMWGLGIAFLLTSALVYMAIMLSWFEIVINITTIVWIRNIIAVIALIGAFLNLRSYFKSKKDNGCEIIDDKKRKKIFANIKKFTSEKYFILALGGVIVLAICVNIVELACSAGLPLLFIQLLALNNIGSSLAFIYTSIYILFFLLDDLIIFIIAMISMKVTGLSTKYSKYSHLIGGILMLLIGLLLIFKPEWLMFNFK